MFFKTMVKDVGAPRVKFNLGIMVRLFNTKSTLSAFDKTFYGLYIC